MTLERLDQIIRDVSNGRAQEMTLEETKMGGHAN